MTYFARALMDMTLTGSAGDVPAGRLAKLPGNSRRRATADGLAARVAADSCGGPREFSRGYRVAGSETRTTVPPDSGVSISIVPP